jgi:HEAT repeat protein
MHHVRIGGLIAKRWPVVGGVLLLAVLGWGGWLVVRALPRPTPEPVYDGNPLSDIFVLALRPGTVPPTLETLLRDTNSVPFLIRTLKRDSWFGAAYYRKWLWPKLPPSIQKRLTPPPEYRPNRRGAAAELLARMGSIAKPAVPVLILALSEDDEYVSERAALALGDLGKGDNSAVVALTKALSDSRFLRVRRSAIIALEKIDPGAPARAVPSLLQKATNVDSSLHCSAIIALGYIGYNSAEPDRIVPVVINALHDADPRTRYFAIGALGELGPNAKAALPALTELLNTSSNEWLRAQVGSALFNIDPEAAAKAGVKAQLGRL